jgi:hypothetical protein
LRSIAIGWQQEAIWFNSALKYNTYTITLDLLMVRIPGFSRASLRFHTAIRVDEGIKLIDELALDVEPGSHGR